MTGYKSLDKVIAGSVMVLDITLYSFNDLILLKIDFNLAQTDIVAAIIRQPASIAW